MPTANALFTAADLSIPLAGRAISDEQAVHAERIVWGWLAGPLGLTERPSPTPDNVWSWAVELAAIYIVNPTGVEEQQLGTSQRKFSSERREQILAEAAVGGLAGVPAPQGSFPTANTYPDPLAIAVPRYW